MNENAVRKNRIVVWAGLTVATALAAFALPFAVGAADLFPSPLDDPEIAGIEPVQQGPGVLLASGETSGGVNYTLTGHQSTDGMCVNFRNSNTPQMESGGCGDVLGGPENISINPAVEGGAEGPWFVYGPTTANVRQVEIALKSGRIVSVPTQPATEKDKAAEALGGDFRFFVAAVPGPLSLPVDTPETLALHVEHSVDTVAALDANGAEIDLYNPPKPSAELPTVAQETGAGHSH